MHTGEKDDKKHQGIIIDELLCNSIITKLMEFENDSNLIQKKPKVTALLNDFSLHFKEMTLPKNKEWVQKMLEVFDIRTQSFSFIPDNQYADHTFALARFIQERQHMIQAPEQQSSPSIPSADPTAFCVGDPLASLDRRVGGMALHDGVLAQPPRNRRSTDPKTPPTQALAHTNTLEAKGLRALLQSLLSKIMP